MNSRIKKFFNNQYIIGIITGIILLVIGYIKFDYVVKVWNYISSRILSFLKYTVTLPVWIIILLFFGFVLIARFKKYVLTKFREDIKPDYFKYREDKFGDLIYKWDYKERYDGKYAIDNITACCPKCKCRLILSYGDTTCPNCNYNTYRKKTFDEIELHSLILHRIESNEYLNKIS